MSTWIKNAPQLRRAITPDYKLVVLHTPKCGGTSLLFSLKSAFGVSDIYRDYGGRLNEVTAPTERIDQAVIYGHFPALRYAHITNAVWVTLLRDPVDRMISLYLNWRYSPTDSLRREVSERRRQVRAGRICLLDFARIPSMSNRLSGAYFREFDMRRFDVIILHGKYAEGLKRLSEIIGVQLKMEFRNVSASRSEQYQRARADVLRDTATLQELRGILKDEIEFYEACAALPNAVR